MKITEKYLREKNACEEGIKYLIENGLIGMEAIQLIEKLIEVDKVDWALWLIVRVMSRKQCIQFACNCARSVLHIFEERFPGDERPRNTIEAAEKFGTPDFDEEKCKAAADNADNAADYATYDAYAYDAANAANAATAATYAAATYAAATYAAAYATYDAANAAYATYDAATYDAATYAANAATYDAATYAANAATYAAATYDAATYDANAAKCGKKVKLSKFIKFGIQMLNK